MAGRVKEGQKLPVVRRHLIRADMLGDTAGLARNHLGVADRIEKRGLAVVHMAHHGDDRRTGLQILVLVLDRVDHVFHVGIGHAHDAVAEILDDQFSSIRVDRLVLRHHHAVLHQRLDHIGHALGHPVGQFRYDDGLGHLNVTHDLFARIRPAQSFLAGAFLLALHRGERTLTPALATSQRLIERELAGAAAVVAGHLAAGFALALLAFDLARRRLRRAGGEIARLRGVGGGFGRRLGGNGLRLGLGGRGLAGSLLLRLLARHRLRRFGLGHRFGLGFRLGPERLFALAVLAFLGLGLLALALTLFLAAPFFFGTLGSLFDLAGFRSLQGLQAALHLGVGNAGGTARRIGAGLTVGSGRLGCVRFGDNDPLALRLDHHVLRPSVAETLLYRAGARSALEAQGLLAVILAHAIPSSFPGPVAPFVLRRPESRALSSTTRVARAPAHSAACITWSRPKDKPISWAVRQLIVVPSSVGRRSLVFPRSEPSLA